MDSVQCHWSVTKANMDTATILHADLDAFFASPAVPDAFRELAERQL